MSLPLLLSNIFVIKSTLIFEQNKKHSFYAAPFAGDGIVIMKGELVKTPRGLSSFLTK